MTYSKDLLESARRLIGGSRGRPRHSDCNRAVSTAYYAIFDHLCRSAANKVVGPVSKHVPPSETWTRVYRSIEHNRAREELARYIPKNENADLGKFATHFVRLQIARIEADYNPAQKFDKSEVEELIAAGASAIKHFDDIPKPVLAALIVALLLPKPKR